MYRKTLLVFAVLLGLVATSASAASQGKPLPQNGKIAYEMWTDRGDPKVYLMDADGSNKTFLVDGEVSGWSPDGKQLLLDHGEKVLTVGTGKITPVFPDSVLPVFSYNLPAWSPDGSQIAVVGQAFEIYTIKPDGTGLKLIYKNPEGLRTKLPLLLSWSPDSKQLTFPLIGRHIAAHIIGTNGKGLTVLRNSTDVYPRGWSLDGRFIFGLLVSEEQFHRGKIVTIEVKTGKLTQLTEPTWIAIDTPEFNLSLSPDGKTLAYTDELGSIFTVRLEGGPPVEISEDLMGISQLQWSPDGKQLVGQCARHGDNIRGDICIVNADGSNLRVLTEPTEKTDFRSPSWQPLAGR